MSATDEQPPPNEGSGPEVWPSVIETQAHLPRELIEDMLARDALGRERYGTPLRTWNGRDAVADAYQEVLDLIAYMEQMRLRLQQEVEEPRSNADPFRVVQSLADLPPTIEAALSLAAWLRGLHADGVIPVEEPTP